MLQLALMAIPIGIGAHLLFDADTALANWIRDKPEHTGHAFAIGLFAGGLSYTALGSSHSVAMTTTLGTSLASLFYMFNYGHKLPKPVRKQMMKAYLRYMRYMN